MYGSIIGLSALLGLTASVLAGLWRYRRLPAGRWHMAFFLCGGLYVATVIGELLAPGPEAKAMWARLEFVALSWAPVAMLSTGLRMNYWPLRRLAPVFVIPAVTTALALTNPYHHLVWTGWQYVPERGVVRGVFGPAFWLANLYSFAVFIAAMYYHIHIMGLLPDPQRKQVVGLLLGIGLIILGSFLVVERVSWPGGVLLAYTGAFTVDASALAWLWLRRNTPYFVAFPLVPREAVVESFPVAVMVLSAEGYVLDANAGFAGLLGTTRDALLGQEATNLLKGWPELAAFCRRALAIPASSVETVTRGGRRYEVRSDPVYLAREAKRAYTITLFDITERESLREQLEVRARHAEALHRLSERLAPLTNVEAVAETTVEVLATVLGYPYAGVFVLDDRTGERVLLASRGWGEKRWRLRPGEGVSEQALLSGRLHYTPDVSADPRYVPGLGKGSEVDVPLFVDGRPGGVLVVEAREVDAFSATDLATLAAVGRVVGQALERARLFERMAKHQERLQLLQEILARLNANPRLDISFRDVGPLLRRLAHADRVSVALLQQDGQTVLVRVVEPAESTLGEMTVVPVAATSAAADVLAGRVHLTPDLEAEQNAPAERTLLAAGYRSRANIPLRVGGRVIGALNFAWQRRQGWDPDVLPLLQQVAEAVALAYERSRLVEQATRQAEELSLAYDVSLALVESRSLAGLLERLVHHLQRLCDPDAVGLFQYVPDRGTLAVVLAVEKGQTLSWLVGQEFPLEEAGLTGWVARKRQTLRFGDITTKDTPVTPRQLTEPPARGWLGVPLILGERLVGVLTVQSARPNAFDEGHQRLLETLAPSIALALDNARLLEAEQAARRRWERLFQAAQSLSTTLDLKEVFERILSELREVVPYDSASVQELRGDRLVIIGGHGFPNLHEIVGIAFDVDDPTSPNGEVVRTRKPRIIGNAWDLYPKFREEPQAPAQIHSWLGVPMLYGDQLVGMITLDKREPNFYTEEHARDAMAFAAQAAIAIQNARLFAAVQAAAERHATLHEAAREIMRAGPDVERVCEALHRAAAKLLPHYTFTVTLIDWERQEVHAVYLVDGQGKHPAMQFPLGEGLTSFVAYRGEPLRLGNVPQDFERLGISPVYFGNPGQVRSVLVVPMRLGDRVVGTLSVQSTEPEAYDEADQEVLELLAATAAGALETARLFQQLQAQADRLQRILDTMPEGVLLLDADGRVVLANPRMREWSDLLGLTWDTAVHTIGGYKVRELVEPPGWRTIRVGENAPRYFQVAGQPIGGPGEANGWLLILRDITREREVEARAREQERLASLGRLAAGIAHDFNNILQGIVGFAQQLAERDDLPTDARQRLRQLADYGHRGVRLVRRMLDFARATRPQFHLCDLRDVVSEAMGWLGEALPRHIRVQLVLTDSPCPVLADREQLEQVIVNLVINARDAMPQGGDLTVAVDRARVSEEEAAIVPGLKAGEWAVLQVSDTGTGIPEDVLPHIFEPFFSTKEVGEGAGLGLAQVYGIVQQHRGAIAVESRVGQGTTFRVYLPLAALASGDTEESGRLVVVWTDAPEVARQLQEWAAVLGMQSAVVGSYAELVQRKAEFARANPVLVVDLTSSRVAEEFQPRQERLARHLGWSVCLLVGQEDADRPRLQGMSLLVWPATVEAFRQTLKSVQPRREAEAA